MEEKEKNSEIVIESTVNFGAVYPNTITFDDQEFFGENIFNYKLHKIRVWCTKQEKPDEMAISGIQVLYKDLETSEIVCPGEFREMSEEYCEDFREYTLQNNEYFVGFTPTVCDESYISCLEFKTNKGKIWRVGGTNGEPKTVRFDKKEVIILGVFGGYMKKLQNLGVYYIAKSQYFCIIYSGFYFLRYTLRKKADFKKKAIEEAKNKDQEYNALLRTCLLPESAFVCVLSFIVY